MGELSSVQLRRSVRALTFHRLSRVLDRFVGKYSSSVEILASDDFDL